MKPDPSARPIIVAMNGFKGTFTNSEACHLVAAGLAQADASIPLIHMPLGDGGSGTLGALTSKSEWHLHQATVQDPLGHPVRAAYALSADGRQGIVEFAQAAGLALILNRSHSPLKTSSYGVGELIGILLEHPLLEHIILTLGDSATVDGGAGILQALGFRFFDKASTPLTNPIVAEDLLRIASISNQEVHPRLNQVHFTLAVDVCNPLLGVTGAAHTFAPQKGALPHEVEALETALQQFAQLLRGPDFFEFSQQPGMGAAGGVGLITSVLKAQLVSGAEFVLDRCGIDNLISTAQLIFTGEGRIDTQTLQGKAPFRLAQRAYQHQIPVIALAGRLDPVSLPLLHQHFAAVFSLVPDALSEVITAETSASQLQHMATQVLRVWLTAQHHSP